MWFNPWYPFHPQDLRGNPSLLSVVAANATADTLGLLILPLLVWLYVAYCMEQSERSSVFPGWMFKFHIPETCQWLSMTLNVVGSVGPFSSLSSLCCIDKDSSLLFTWPSISPYFELNVTQKIHLQMFAFGAVTCKPLTWRGSWKGLRILRSGLGIMTKHKHIIMLIKHF